MPAKCFHLFFAAMMLFAASARAADGSGKQTRFEYSLSTYIRHTPAGWYVQDFAAAIANPNKTPIWVQVTLISDDPDFQFPEHSVCPSAKGTCTGGSYS